MKFGKIEGNDYNNLIMNDAINAFRIAVGDNISLQSMVDMFVDEYEDETGVDTGSSINILYDSTNDYYSMGEGDTTTVDNMEYATDLSAKETYEGGRTISLSQTEKLTDASFYDFLGGTGTDEKLAQKFTVGGTAIKVSQIKMYLFKSSNPTDNIYLTIEGNSGGFPDGTPIATSEDIAGTSLTTSGAEYTFIFGTQATLTASTIYHFVIQRDGSRDATHKYNVNVGNSGGGGLSERDNGSWNAKTYDMTYKVYTDTIGVFSEDTIKEQGSYALKIEAAQTDSLNETLTKTFSIPLDLSNRDVIKFKARATRTGTNFKLHLITDQFGLDITSGQSYLASSTWAQYSVSNCFDNDVASCWTCDDAQTTNQWIRIQFSSPKSINKIRLLNGGWNISETIRYAKIEASNNTSDWIKIPCISWDVCEQYNVDEIKYAQINDTTSWQTVELRNYNSYTYWRVFIYDAYSSTSERIREIEMMEGIQYGYDVAISSANTWETKELDISGIANDDKDVIKYLELEIINADLANTIYLDEMYSYANATGFTLISENQTAVSEPDEARIVVLMEEVSAITLNTDLKAWASKDDGITWAQVTLEDVGDYGDSIKILYGEVDLTQSGIGSGTDIVYRLTTHNNKNCKIHGTSPAWR